GDRLAVGGLQELAGRVGDLLRGLVARGGLRAAQRLEEVFEVLEYFLEALRRAQASASHKTAQQITDAAGELLQTTDGKPVPDFIAQRLGKLESLINMVHDEGWAMAD